VKIFSGVKEFLSNFLLKMYTNNNRRGRGGRARGRGRNSNRKRNTTKTVGLGTIGRQNPLKFNFQAPSVETVMRYNDTHSSSVTPNGTISQIYNLNSIFDPYAAIGGHNPQGYTQMAAMYNRYLVTKTNVVINVGSVPATIFVAAAPCNGGFTLQMSYNDIAEFPFGYAAVVGANGGPNFVYSRTFAISNLCGVSKTKYLIDDRYSALINANPAEQIQVAVYVFNPNSATQVVQINVRLEYMTIFSDPINPANVTKEWNEVVLKQHGINVQDKREKAISLKMQDLTLIHNDCADDDNVDETDN